MMYITKKIITYFKIIARTEDWLEFTKIHVTRMHDLKSLQPHVFNELLEFRERLLIESGNEIKMGDNAWMKIYLAFKSLNKRGCNTSNT